MCKSNKVLKSSLPKFFGSVSILSTLLGEVGEF